jgi:hypothetical protein
LATAWLPKNLLAATATGRAQTSIPAVLTFSQNFGQKQLTEGEVMSSKKLHSEKRKVIVWCSVRVSSETRKLAEGILKTANDKETGRKIKLDELLQTGLGLIQQSHIEKLQENSLTHEDRKEILRQKYIVARGPISKDEFTGFMMTQEFLGFVAEQGGLTLAASA